MVKRIVIVNFTRMGDLIQSGPLMRSLKETHPEAKLTAIVFNAFLDVAMRLPMIDDVLVFDVDRFIPALHGARGALPNAYRTIREFLSDYRLSNIDILYNLAHTPQSATLCGLMKPRVAYGRVRLGNGQMMISGAWFQYLFSVLEERSLNPYNLVELNLRTNPGAWHCSGLELNIQETDRQQARRLLSGVGVGADQNYIALQPGASSPSRQWPVSHFTQLAKRLRSNYIVPVIVGSDNEIALAAEIVERSDNQALSIAGQTDIGVLGAVLEGASKLVSNDTGTIHVAAAVGTPSIGLYLGPAAAKDTAPYGNGHIVLEADIPCSPCGYRQECRTYHCHSRIDVDAVFDLCMADGDRQSEVAAGLVGVRAYRTKVDRNGEFALHLLNRPLSGYDLEMLKFYRWFWNSLLNCKTQAESFKIPDIVSGDEWRKGIARLREIHRAMDLWLQNLIKLMQSPLVTREQVTAALRSEALFHEQMRCASSEFALLAPIARYFMVQMLNLSHDELVQHVDEYSQMSALLRKTIMILQTAHGTVETCRNVYAENE